MGASPHLAALRDRIQQSSRCLEAVLPLLPEQLRTQVLSGPLDGAQWCLISRSTAASTKLRQLLPSLLLALQDRGLGIEQIRIKVQKTPS